MSKRNRTRRSWFTGTLGAWVLTLTPLFEPVLGEAAKPSAIDAELAQKCLLTARTRAGAFFKEPKLVRASAQGDGFDYLFFDGNQGLRLSYSPQCHLHNVRKKSYTWFERASLERPVALVVFWSPHSVLDEDNFQALYRLNSKFGQKLQILLVIDPLSNHDYVVKALTKGGLPSVEQSVDMIQSGQNGLLTFYADATGLKSEIPLCEFPLTYVWAASPRGVAVQQEWMGEFPEHSIAGAIKSALN